METTLLPKTRKEAKALNSKFYFTGKPCRHGHLSERQVSDAVCVACKREAGRKNSEYFKDYYKNNSEIIKTRTKKRHAERSASDPNYEKDRYSNAKQYHAEYRANNRKIRIKMCRRLYLKNKEARLLYNKRYRKVNLDKIREYSKKHYAENKPYYFAAVAKRRAAKIKATPPWLTDGHFKEIEAFYIQARELTEVTGTQHHVDHIIPLQGVDVCGLHVPWNLQVLTAKENLAKSNKILIRGMGWLDVSA